MHTYAVRIVLHIQGLPEYNSAHKVDILSFISSSIWYCAINPCFYYFGNVLLHSSVKFDVLLILPNNLAVKKPDRISNNFMDFVSIHQPIYVHWDLPRYARWRVPLWRVLFYLESHRDYFYICLPHYLKLNPHLIWILDIVTLYTLYIYDKKITKSIIIPFLAQ